MLKSTLSLPFLLVQEHVGRSKAQQAKEERAEVVEIKTLSRSPLSGRSATIRNSSPPSSGEARPRLRLTPTSPRTWATVGSHDLRIRSSPRPGCPRLTAFVRA
eukprot:756651-Hanusia_phi.AAC.2